MKIIKSESPEKTYKTGYELASMIKSGSVIGLKGSLGAGKTVFVSGIADFLAIEDPITSPTFTLINEYEANIPLYHMDMYRIGSMDEFEILGIDHLIYGHSGISVIEWYEIVREYLPENLIEVEIKILEDGVREIRIEGDCIENNID